jgi:hypothetical protein
MPIRLTQQDDENSRMPLMFFSNLRGFSMKPCMAARRQKKRMKMNMFIPTRLGIRIGIGIGIELAV